MEAEHHVVVLEGDEVLVVLRLLLLETMKKMNRCSLFFFVYERCIVFSIYRLQKFNGCVKLGSFHCREERADVLFR